MGQLEARFYDLSKLALPEEWDFRLKGKDSNYEILSNYLQTTFSKLYNDSQILFSSNKRYAVFNTGLVNILYKPIYALFTQNDNPVNDRQWKLVDFCVEGENRAGKLLVSEFEKMPLPAHYFKNCQDLVYAIDADVPQLDHEHIILERLERYPYSVLRKYMPENVIPLQQIETLSEQDRNTYFEQFREALRNDSQTYNAFKEKIDSAVKLAVDRAHWNYKSAIPMYYPKKQRICLLLPLCLQNNNTADLALVVSRGKSGRYQGETIYLLDWAYKCARLVCRPDSDWLSPQVIHISNEDEDKGA